MTYNMAITSGVRCPVSWTRRFSSYSIGDISRRVYQTPPTDSQTPLKHCKSPRVPGPYARMHGLRILSMSGISQLWSEFRVSPENLDASIFVWFLTLFDMCFVIVIVGALVFDVGMEWLIVDCLLFLTWSVVRCSAVRLNPDAVQINICRLDFEPVQLLHAPSLSTGFSDCKYLVGFRLG